uniref:Tyrosine-protein phosphatase domain-containing protein n=1 Tax=Macrostomum lignano TaxID=282301 RepID=A0A1I8HT86_9PLAT
ERARPYLLTHDCASSTDFINAVYIDGHTRSNQYIVTQWPLRNTICDFWKLVNDHHVAVVVLLVDYSNSSRSYPRFWPNARNEETGYGSVYVILQDQFSVGTSIRVRMHTVAKVIRKECHLESLKPMQAAAFDPEQQAGSCSTGLSQRARHVAFLCLDGASWPAGARAPASGHGLLELVCLAEETNQAMECTSPILVVSSNGVSRCGPFCVLHMTMDKLRFEGEIDIFRAVEKVKRNRPQLVEN